MTTESQQPDTPVATAAPAYIPPPRRRGTGWAWVILLLLIAFCGGIAASFWAPAALRQWVDGAQSAPADAGADKKAQLADGSGNAAPPSPRDIATLEARLALLSRRMDDLSARAQNAGAYASRAEALMIAFAARRALDGGQPLGYLEGELRIRFAEAQPRAVATIISAAKDPVTLADLQAGLATITPSLTGKQAQGDWWEEAKQELSHLFILRRASTPSPLPAERIERARTLLSVGQVDAALREVEKLDQVTKTQKWEQRARRYNEARRALDVIEAAAILEPRALPVPGQAVAGDLPATQETPPAP